MMAEAMLGPAGQNHHQYGLFRGIPLPQEPDYDHISAEKMESVIKGLGGSSDPDLALLITSHWNSIRS